ncbi:HalOD1 output domain-containing protein [Halegenticoccus soli]|uniref:HalOD1 output domain-containing protein n=1 Tax=Halegenticoccus soli TaxID=1985678 RepID=UPI000C6CB522|nr:HalOD1 output domain-containing protein [Halegenticoccus soli]
MPDERETDSSTDSLTRLESLVSQYHYDLDETYDLTAAILKAVAKAEEVDLLSITGPPFLYDSIDAVALEESLFTDPTSADPQAVQFSFYGYEITVESNGWIQVYERPPG